MAKRKYGKNIAFMMEFVRKFIDEESGIFDIICDFNYHIIQRYDAMYDENPEIAEVIGSDMGDIIDNIHDTGLLGGYDTLIIPLLRKKAKLSLDFFDRLRLQAFIKRYSLCFWFDVVTRRM